LGNVVDFDVHGRLSGGALMFEFGERPRVVDMRDAFAGECDLRAGFLRDALVESERRLRIDWGENHAFGKRSPERGDPSRAAFGPDRSSVALADPGAVKPGANRVRDLSDIGVAIGPAAIAVVEDDELGVELRRAIQIVEQLARQGPPYLMLIKTQVWVAAGVTTPLLTITGERAIIDELRLMTNPNGSLAVPARLNSEARALSRNRRNHYPG
jgi:hypothetical protein